LPVRTIGSLHESPLVESNLLVHIQGTVLDERLGEYVVVNDGTGTLFAETPVSFLPGINEKVEVQGTLVRDGALLRLQNASVRAPGSDSTVPASPAPQSLTRPSQLPLLSKALQVRSLSEQQAAWKYPVKLKGVVTVNIKANNYFFVQDDTCGITIKTDHVPDTLDPGDLVRIEGVSDPGGYSPMVLATNIIVLGKAPLPEAREETIFQLSAGQDGSQWIEVRGVVRSIEWSAGLAQLGLADLTGVMSVTIPATNRPDHLLDAVVSIRGACGTRANARRQLISFQMYASSLDFVEVELAGNPDPLSRPAQPIASLSQFRSSQNLTRRVTVAGTISLSEPGHCFYLQDASNAVQVLFPANSGLKPGDYALVAGYPAIGDYGQVLRDAMVRVLKHGPPSAPDLIPPHQSLDAQWHARRVRIEGRFLSRLDVGKSERLTVQIDNRIVEATCLSPLPEALRNLPQGSQVRLTGVYRILPDESRQPASFHLLLDSANDLQVVQRPSWWTATNTFRLVSLLLLILAITTLWILLLRRKVSEQTASLLLSEQKFRSLVEQSLVGVYIIQDGRFAYVNPREAEILGYSPEELLQIPVGQTVHPEDLLLVERQMRLRLESKERISHYAFRCRRKDGSVIHVEVLGSATEFNGRPAILGTTMDVTERKAAEEALGQASSLLQTLLDNSPDCIYFKDTESRFVCFSKAFENLFHLADSQTIHGKTDFDFFSEEHARLAYEDEQQIIRTGNPLVGKLEKETHRDGRVTWALTTKMPWRDKAGRIIGTFGTSKDVTPMKEAEAKLEAAHRRLLETSRLAGMAEVATAVLHNVGNVLNSVNVSCSLILDRAKISKVFNLPKVSALLNENQDRLGEFLTSDPRGRQIPAYLRTVFEHLAEEQSAQVKELETLLTHVDHIKQIVAMQQGYAKVAGVREPVSPVQLMEDALQINAGGFARRQIRVCREFGAAPEIPTEKHKVLQILVNLLRNAAEAVEQSGRAEKTITVRVASEGAEYVRLEVADNGVGISAENLTRIFGHGFTTRPNGHGFGLHSSALASRELGGALKVHSDGPGLGATFTLLLPRISPEAPAAGPRVPEGPMAFEAPA
jgi:PAS domain S-box-containing protein